MTGFISYLALTTGIVGTGSGVVGAILGIKNYVWIKREHRRDARVALHRELVTTQELAYSVQRLITEAVNSKISVIVSAGRAGSSSFEAVRRAADQDRRHIDETVSCLPTADDITEQMDDDRVADSSKVVHAACAKLVGIKEKYEASVQADRRMSSRIIATHSKPGNR